jgi:putative N6-adenine-specific DNA methylase
MMARGIAPGLQRHFRIESLPCHDGGLLSSIRDAAREKIYPSGSYKIYGRDLDPQMIEIARANAVRAGVADDIVFSVRDYMTGNLHTGISQKQEVQGRKIFSK